MTVNESLFRLEFRQVSVVEHGEDLYNAVVFWREIFWNVKNKTKPFKSVTFLQRFPPKVLADPTVVFVTRKALRCE